MLLENLKNDSVVGYECFVIGYDGCVCVYEVSELPEAELVAMDCWRMQYINNFIIHHPNP